MKTKTALMVLITAITVAGAIVKGIEGSVILPDGTAARGATVRFYRIDKNGPGYSVKTNKVGHYGHYGLPEGTYRVQAFTSSGALIGQRDNVLFSDETVQIDLCAESPCSTVLAEGAKKAATPPSQPDVTAGGCVHITDIHSHTGWAAAYRFDAVITDGCSSTESIFLTLGYFDRGGEQYSQNVDFITLAAGAFRHYYDRAPNGGLLGPVWQTTRIISAMANPQ